MSVLLSWTKSNQPDLFDRLEALAEALLDFTSVRDLESWLG
ncbi:DUF4351 domain-containing protein [Chamaesiphon sp. OTE_20_metabat_361]